MRPVPFENTGVKVVLPPVVMVEVAALKLVHVGAGTTATVTVRETDAGFVAPFVTVSVNVVVVVSAPVLFATPLETAPTLLSTLPVPLANTAVRVVLPFVVTVEAAAAK